MRFLITILFLTLATATSSAQQPAERVFRLAQIAPSQASLDLTRSMTLPELAKLGFVEGRNLALIERFGPDAAMPALMRELLGNNPDAIIAIGPEAVRAATAATTTVPIVGFASQEAPSKPASMTARPGRNLTGVVILAAQLDAKRLEILREAVPTARNFAAIMLPSTPQRADSERAMRKFASESQVGLQVFDVNDPADYAAAFARMRASGAEAVVITANAIFYRDGARLAALALDAKLPSVCEWADMAAAGCLMGYGPSRTEMRRRIAHLVARIFRGAAPSDLPIETPTHFEFAINLKVARSLGITISTELQTRANSIVE